MNYIREKVSGKKKRFIKEGYNLDLTYVTKRIIAMSYPGEGLEGLYRNPIDQVATYLNTQHNRDYMVFNLSGRKYDRSKFGGEVQDDWQWKDHHSPSLDLLFEICDLIHGYLKGDKVNVVVIHCLAGKGRTGTIICCYLLYTGKFQSVADVLYYYGTQRFEVEGLGVNQPCQMKYIEYFYKLLTMGIKGQIVYPTFINIKRITFQGKAPAFSMNGTCKPYMQIIQVKGDKEIYSTQKDAKKYKGVSHDLLFGKVIPICGDILIKVFNDGMLKNQKMFRLAFNTAFIDETAQNTLQFSLKDLDPSQLLKDDRFDKNFQVVIQIEPCIKCNNKTEFNQLCNFCKPHLINEEKQWNKIIGLISQYKVPDDELATELLFINKSFDDVEEIMQFKRSENSNDYDPKTLENINKRSRAKTIKFQQEQLQQQQQQIQQQEGQCFQENDIQNQ
ncbi:unnamed protein product [Paramecium sonneborni]|uniref:Phosphatidylinositol-3,4,5-trisphosphate 3-phosphatase n=1 Tax=Paramecium sonneborni TaxID=65129 RepID=A0A8S1QDL4_9CILI|nr:unnamed protein product [Paramecium sonneborni]